MGQLRPHITAKTRYSQISKKLKTRCSEKYMAIDLQGQLNQDSDLELTNLKTPLVSKMLSPVVVNKWWCSLEILPMSVRGDGGWNCSLNSWDGWNVYQRWQLYGGNVYGRKDPIQNPNSKETKQIVSFGNFMLEFRTKHIKWSRAFLWVALSSGHPWCDWGHSSGGFRNWILSLALAARLRRAVYVLAMMGTDRSKVVLLFCSKETSFTSQMKCKKI